MIPVYRKLLALPAKQVLHQLEETTGEGSFGCALAAVNWTVTAAGRDGSGVCQAHLSGHEPVSRSASASSPPPKPKMTAEERRARGADRLKMIRLRMMIWRALNDAGITTPIGIGAALGMLGPDATKLLTRHKWREGDVALLEAAVVRLGLALER